MASLFSRAWDFLKLLYLMNESNHKAYTQPVTLFAMLSIASGYFTTGGRPGWADLARALVHVLLYIGLFILQFDLSNQKDPESVEEDKLNKPWRPIPSGKLSIQSAQRGHVAAVFLQLVVPALWLGGLPESIVFLAETWIYDHASFGSRIWWSKNILNALFYMTGQLGSTRVAARAMGMPMETKTTWQWCTLLALNTLMTLHIQDMRDQAGDRARGRRTMPLVFGDQATRLVTAALICFWSVASPAYWSRDHITAAYVLPALVGVYVSSRLITRTAVQEDRRTFYIYVTFWLSSLYLAPLLSRYDLASMGQRMQSVV